MNKVIFIILFIGLSSKIYGEEKKILSIPFGVLDFGEVKVNESRTKNITVSNEGDSILTISRIRLHEKVEDSYKISNWVGALAPDQSVDINITFMPKDKGKREGLFYIDSDRTNSGDRSRLLRGRGILDENSTVSSYMSTCTGAFDILGNGDYGRLSYGDTVSRTFQIKNRGTIPLILSNVYLHPYIKEMFTINGEWSNVTVAGEESVFITIDYHPTKEAKGKTKGLFYVKATTCTGTNSKFLDGRLNVSVFPLKKTGQTKSFGLAYYEVMDGSLKDDGYYQKGLDSNFTRDDEKEIVTDHITGLMWQDNLDAKQIVKPWITEENYALGDYNNSSGDTAITYCYDLVLGGYNDWRLPSRQELDTIVRYSPSWTALTAMNSIFKNVAEMFDIEGGKSYWSATPSAFWDKNAWFILFSHGAMNSRSKRDNCYVRCVRDK